MFKFFKHVLTIIYEVNFLKKIAGIFKMPAIYIL